MSDESIVTGTFTTGNSGQRMKINADRVIYRYRIPIVDFPVVQLPERADILSVGPSRDDRDELDLWVLVNPHAPLHPVPLRVVGTGKSVSPDDGTFIGTVATHGGLLVWHVFGPRL